MWRTFARQELEREILRQVYPDGVDREQAFYYHLWVLEYLLFVWLLAAQAGKPMSPDFGHRLRKMGAFLHAVTPPGGNPPQVGDADDGFVTRFEAEWPREPYDSVLAAMELAFPGHAFRSKTGTVTGKGILVRVDRRRIHDRDTTAADNPCSHPGFSRRADMPFSEHRSEWCCSMRDRWATHRSPHTGMRML